MTEKQGAHASGLDEYFWQIVDRDLHMLVHFRKRKGGSTDPSTDVDDSGIFLERKL